MPRIEKLSLAGFRGASKPMDITIDATKPLAIIFGENGTGKSSIIDGIDFVCNKQFGSVEEHSGTTPKEHVISLKCASADLAVTITAGGQTWIGKLNKGQPAVAGTGLPPKVTILRRTQIAKIINARPLDRYESLKEFIALPGIEGAEKTLRECLLSIKTDYEQIVAAKEQAEELLANYWIEEKKPGTGFMAWAKSRAKEDSTALKTSITQTKGLINSFEKAQSAIESYGDSVKVFIDTEGKLKKAGEALSALGPAAQESELIDILEDAKKYLPKSSKPDECPLCERPGIKIEELLARIDVRLKAMTRTILLKGEFEKAKKAHTDAIAVSKATKASVINSAWLLAKALKKSALPEVIKLALDWSQYKDITIDVLPSFTEEIFREAQKIQIASKTCLEPITTRHNAETRALNQLGMIQKSVAAVESNINTVKDLERQLIRGQSILKIIEDQRKTYVEQILAGISTEVGTLCDKIHPGEGIKIKFLLDPKKRASAEILGEFEGEKNIPPQAYYSESHLDTLGVCIFLALTKRFQGKDAIVVLDDVLTSVDAPHMDRFMNLLIDEADNFTQVVIATHYRPWLEKFRHARGHTAKAHLIHLSPWTLLSGIRSGHAKLAVKELRDFTAAVPFDRQVAASKAGIFLESLLDQLALLYECKVPRKPEPVYTLGELMDSFGKKFLPALKSELHIDGASPKTTELKPLFENISSFSWIRNQVGCHWNMAGFDVPDADVLKFVQKTLVFADAIICPKCGSLPTKSKTGTHWQCRCKENKGLRLCPLENPDYI